MSGKWSNLELSVAIGLHDRGLMYNEISEKIGRTEKAVRLKLNKLGKKQNRNKLYETVTCGYCNETFKALISDERKYCSQSCAASQNNLIHPKRQKVEKEKRKIIKIKNINKCICLNCSKVVRNKFCDIRCQNEFNKKEKYHQLLDGKLKGTVSTICRWWRKYLIEITGECCDKCGWNEKNLITNKVPLELNHIDGNHENNNVDNLELLCPNCHALTPNYKALNTGNGRAYRRERYKEGKSY